MNVEKEIWDLLLHNGFTQQATAGIMGNTYAESLNKPNNLQNSGNTDLGLTDEEYTSQVNTGKYTNFVYDSIGYGICQWTHWSRKKALLEFAQSSHVSIADTNMQVSFLIRELKSYGLLNKIKTSKNIREVTKIILTQFEKPASVINKPDEEVEKVVEKRYKHSLRIYNDYKDTYSEDLSVLYNANVINSPDYWENHKYDIQYLNVLVKNAADKISEMNKNTYSQIDKDLNVLYKYGVLTDKDYWREQASRLRYTDALLHNIAEKIRKLISE